MITLIHGEDTSTARERLKEEKERYGESEFIYFDGRRLRLADLVYVFDSPSLLLGQRVLIIEQFFSGILGREKEEILKFLTRDENAKTGVIFIENKEVGKLALKKLGHKLHDIRCQPPLLLFRFLDNVGVTGPKELLSQFHSLLSQKEAELVFALLLSHFRKLIIARDLGKRGFPEASSWQTEKIVRQASRFSLADLITSYRQLLQIDYQIKSGQTPLELFKLLDIFLVNL